MSPVIPEEKELIFEPSSDVLDTYGVTAKVSLVIGNDRHMCVPIENYNGVTAYLNSGVKLGAVHALELPIQEPSSKPVSVTASVQSLVPSPPFREAAEHVKAACRQFVS